MSPRNSVPAIINMLKQTSCHRIVTQPALSALLSGVQSELEEEGYDLDVDELPGLDEVFPSVYDENASVKVEPYPPPQTPYNPKDVALFAHSSGSTGFPKPIPQRHENVLECCNSCASHILHLELVYTKIYTCCSHCQDGGRPQNHLGRHGAAHVPHDGGVHPALRSTCWGLSRRSLRTQMACVSRRTDSAKHSGGVHDRRVHRYPDRACFRRG